MHDKQPAFPRPRFLREARDPTPAPQPAFRPWAIDWNLWSDLSDGGWSRLTLWERWLAVLFLPEDSASLPTTRDSWAAAAGPLSAEEADWFLAGPPSSAPDPFSRFKLRAMQVFPPRLQQVAVRLGEVSLTRGVAGPSLTTSATGHIPKQEGGTRPIGLMAELLKRTEGLAARRVAAAAAAAPPGTLLSGLNSAYQAGHSVDPILGLIRVLMEADSMCDWGLI